jgi:hypothetical protein
VRQATGSPAVRGRSLPEQAQSEKSQGVGGQSHPIPRVATEENRELLVRFFGGTTVCCLPGSIGTGLDNLKRFWKIGDSHPLQRSPFCGRKRIGLGDWRQIFALVNLIERRDALHSGSWLTSLHWQAEPGFGPTITGCFDAEGRELALGWTRQAVTTLLTGMKNGYNWMWHQGKFFEALISVKKIHKFRWTQGMINDVRSRMHETVRLLGLSDSQDQLFERFKEERFAESYLKFEAERTKANMRQR